MASRGAVLCCCGGGGGGLSPCAAHFNACAGPPPVVVSFTINARFRTRTWQRVGISPSGLDVCLKCPWQLDYEFDARFQGTATGIWSSYGQPTISMQGIFSETIVERSGAFYCPDPCQVFPGCFPFIQDCATTRWSYSIPASLVMSCTPIQQPGEQTRIQIEGGGTVIGGGTVTRTQSGNPYCGGSGSGTSNSYAVNAGFFLSIYQRGCTGRPSAAISLLAPTECVPTPNYVIPGYSVSDRIDPSCYYRTEESSGTISIGYATAASFP